MLLWDCIRCIWVCEGKTLLTNMILGFDNYLTDTRKNHLLIVFLKFLRPLDWPLLLLTYPFCNRISLKWCNRDSLFFSFHHLIPRDFCDLLSLLLFIGWFFFHFFLNFILLFCLFRPSKSKESFDKARSILLFCSLILLMGLLHRSNTFRHLLVFFMFSFFLEGT